MQFFIDVNQTITCFEIPRSSCSCFEPTTVCSIASTVCSARNTSQRADLCGLTANKLILTAAFSERTKYRAHMRHCLQITPMQEAADHSPAVLVILWLRRTARNRRRFRRKGTSTLQANSTATASTNIPRDLII
jgi:hypothetical protein